MTTLVAPSTQALTGSRMLQLLLLCAGALVVIGTVMIASSSIDVAARINADPFFYIYRQILYVIMALVIGLAAVHVPMDWWLRSGWMLLFLAIGVLCLVLTPIGRSVNGSTRWISLGVINVQVSEIAKICLIAYLAGYVVRRRRELLHTWGGFIRPIAVLGGASALLLMEPDFGATLVMMAAAMGMIFLSGVGLSRFLPLVTISGALAVMLVAFQPYRLKRVVAYLDPWQDPYDSGYQLTNSLIAFGRGEWFGVGLGNSVQKLSFLPEAHTDFIFSIISEEFGLMGSLIVLTLYALLVWAGLRIARAAEQQGLSFHACFAYGVILLIGFQAFINTGVASGLLPTKGLTLPLISYGGSSLLANSVCIAILARIEMERLDRLQQQEKARNGR